MLEKACVQLRSNLPPSNYTKRLPIKGLLLPRCRSVCLMVVLCLSVSYAQRQEISSPQSTQEATPSPQSKATPIPNGQTVPSPEPASSPASATSGVQLSSGL